MAKTFSASVDAWALKSKARLTAIFRESAQRVGEEANTTVHEGGKLPIDTGFLRSSYAVSMTGMPLGLGEPPDREAKYRPDNAAIDLVINQAVLGDTIWGGWTARYAPIQEERNGFQRSAAQRWPQIVTAVTAEAKARYP